MKNFTIDKNAHIDCQSINTRSGFKHEATLYVQNQPAARAKIGYYNRTWERFEFESVIKKVLSNSSYLTPRRQKNFLARLNDKTNSRFTSIAMIAKLGQLIEPDQKKQNDWLMRMLGNQGLSKPADWDQLPEDVKTKRLNEVIKVLTN